MGTSPLCVVRTRASSAQGRRLQKCPKSLAMIILIIITIISSNTIITITIIVILPTFLRKALHFYQVWERD